MKQHMLTHKKEPGSEKTTSPGDRAGSASGNSSCSISAGNNKSNRESGAGKGDRGWASATGRSASQSGNPSDAESVSNDIPMSSPGSKVGGDSKMSLLEETSGQLMDEVVVEEDSNNSCCTASADNTIVKNEADRLTDGQSDCFKPIKNEYLHPADEETAARDTPGSSAISSSNATAPANRKSHRGSGSPSSPATADSNKQKTGPNPIPKRPPGK
jgi:hypothetical protein